MTSANTNNHAIVFVHGILGFSSRQILGREIHYFRALQAHLRDCPQPIFFPALPSVGLIEDRARALANYLGGISAKHIDLIAHSMGGLDSRYLIHHLDPQQRIHSLSTIATPHRGSPLAQWTLDNTSLHSAFLRRIAQPGLHDLTPKACARFNAEISDRSDVIYYSYAGHRPISEMPLIFRPWTRDIQNSDGDNDSQVPVASAIWGEFKGTLRADHLELAGWSFGWPNKRNERPFAHIMFYRHLVQQLCSG
jgi:triacylglycerol lipase